MDLMKGITMTDLANKVAEYILANYKAGEVLTTTKFDEINKACGHKSIMELAKRVWSCKERVNAILMQDGLWLFTISAEHIKLVDVPEHMIRSPTFARLSNEITKHANNATKQLEYFKPATLDREKEVALSKIVWEMENLSTDVADKILKIGQRRSEAFALVEEWIKDSIE